MPTLAEELAQLSASIEKESSPTELEFDLVPEEGTTGILKQLALDQIATYKTSGFKIAVLEKHIVHGHYDGDESTPASLLVYEFHVRSERKNLKRRIRFLSVSVRFETDPPGSPSQDPFLISWEPAMKATVAVNSNIVKHTEGEDTKLAVVAKKGPVPLEATVERGRSKQIEFDRPDRVLCSSNPSKTPGRGGERKNYDKVVWMLHENKSQEMLPDAFCAAMVVKRTPKVNMKVVFEVGVYIDWWRDVSASLGKAATEVFKGRREMSKTYNVTEPGEVLDGLKKDHLKELAVGDKLMDFCWFHIPEEIATKEFY
ncbi:hypothetical protein FOXG_14872 [Fusarium oxysporum f. sp. lycopersici 4287]|uniref:Uncharacterized protein n=1 Tax=Fusarium oxysporum f. sp. lycopersici (strain 4287 / CBS 123668 / FGSC 9935 / NRRL 34936) TaxID=426428 RepID=A0A0J9WTY2_FUSO4|nr:hypothetical protein FOXG_14872 [Fusarium oxysporum f. sp. lycopersici 4287]KAJ9412546.1 hypothetical protein QL093DRAFT_1153367 [Fusarium oxysporum]KNB16827.1 hypothetical protein FOXG_14872 [Fusarium oxysporum f. sp. lycopersici 4287]